MPSTQIFEVDQILQSRIRKGRQYFKVSWKGYPMDESTWQPQENLTGCEQLLREFKSRQKRGLEEEQSEEVLPYKNRQNRQAYKQASQQQEEKVVYAYQQPQNTEYVVVGNPRPDRKMAPTQTPLAVRTHQRDLVFEEEERERDAEEQQEDESETLVQEEALPESIQVIEMVEDAEQDIYFSIRQDKKTDTIPRKQMISRDIRALLFFYEKFIHFKPQRA